MRSASSSAVLSRSMWLATLLAGCLELPPPPMPRDAAPVDASSPPRVLSVRVLDASEREWDDGAIPRAPRIVIVLSAPIAGEPEPVLLLAGEDDDDLRSDLTSAPLRAATSARAIACERRVEGSKIEVMPVAPLAPGARLVIAIGGWARDDAGHRIEGPWAQALRVADDARAGARALETWPPDGATAIGTALPLAGVRFDGEVFGRASGLWIEGPDGERVPGSARAARCDEIGWEGDHCAALIPSRALAPGVVHTIRSGTELRDATGAVVPMLFASFTTALEPDLDAPGFATMACAVDELTTEAGCVLADDSRLALRVRATEPARIRLEAAGQRALAIAPRGEATLELGSLAAGASIAATLVAIDAAGHERRIELALATTDALPLVSIVEVRADPYGAEPRQEYVEIANVGTETIDLEGFALSDSPGAEGDVIAGSHRLTPGARALLVAEGFDAEDRGDGDRDVAIPPGVPLIRLDRSLASGGLSNAGEPLFLRDPLGRRISAAPAEPLPRPGVCVVRTSDDPRTGARGSFDYDVIDGCTPGR